MQPSDASLLTFGTYSPWLVGLSLAIAVFTSTMALQIAGVAALIRGRWQRQLAIASGAIALGGGTWAMHFVGMLAFDLCTLVTYDIRRTLLSLLPSLAASWVALELMARTEVSKAQWLAGGMLVGAGIGAMHYSGMAAMQMAPALRYDPLWFVLSVVVANALALLALRIRFGMHRLAVLHGLRPWQTLLASGCVMGLAIAGMHYIGMAAARFVAPAGFVPEQLKPEADWVALLIALATVLLTMLIALGATVMLRYRQLLQQMQASETRLQAIVDTAANGLVLLDPDGVVKTFNPAAERMFGWRADEVVGKEASVLLQPPYDKQFLRFLQAYRLAGSTLSLGSELDSIGQHRDGHAMPFRVSIGKAVLDDGVVFVCFITDTRERKAMEQALRDSELQYRSLMGNTPGMAFRRLLTPRWPLVVMSEGALGVTGYPAEAFMSGEVVFRNLIFTDDLARVEPLMQRAMDEKTPYESEFRIRHRDGGTRWVMSRGRVAHDENGAPRFFDGLIMDITERRTMEDALVAAKDRAELAAASKSAFLANMSHEIRTPMNAIIGFTEFLMGTELTPLQHRHLGTVRQSARSLLGLLNDILDTAKLEKGAVELELADFSLEAVATQVVEAQRLAAEAKGLQLQLQYQAGMGRYFVGDAMRIQQVLSNLVGNAVKFTSQGFVRLEVFEDAGQVHMAVHDSGIGIAAERLDRIFDPFSQADASMSRRFGGTGLGTTIARQLVDLMHGRLWVNSTLGVGSDFHVRLPLAPGHAVQESVEGLLFQLPPLRILAVDDVLQNLELLGLVLGNAGHEVVMASDGEQAVAAWEAHAFDVVLMDVQMPGMDGLEATRRIRRREQERGLPRTPVIALTASVLEKNRSDTVEAGMNGFATKPLELRDLVGEIARVLGMDVPSGADPAAPAPAQNLQPVDWVRGAHLWGNAATQAQGIRRLLAEHQDVGLSLEGMLDDGRLDAARQTVHRLRGTAGNLSLMALHALASELEHAIRAQDLEAARAALPGLEPSLAAIWSALGMVTLPESRAQAAGEGPQVTAAALGSVAYRQQAEAMVASLRRGEMDESMLLPVVQAWQAAGQGARAQELEEAFNTFEFGRAEELISESLVQPA